MKKSLDLKTISCSGGDLKPKFCNPCNENKDLILNKTKIYGFKEIIVIRNEIITDLGTFLK